MRHLTIATLVATLAACSTAPTAHVRTDQDPTADLKAYKTFAFYEPSERAGYTSIVSRRFERAAREQLEAHGYVYDARDPDLRVSWMLKVAERQELRSSPSGPAYRGWNSNLQTVEYRRGTLRIDLVDTRRFALVWQGVAEGRIDAKAEKQPGTALEAAVGEIFASFQGH